MSFGWVCPLPFFQSLLSALAMEPSRSAWLRLGQNGEEWLARDFSLVERPARDSPVLRVVLAEGEGELAHVSALGAVGTFVIGRGQWRGSAWFVPPAGAETLPAGLLHLRGSGLHTVFLSVPGQAPETGNSTERIPERWSRSVGALGEAPWRRLTAQRFALIGCGRSGSLLAAGLIRLGVADLALIDPDYVDVHTLGEADGVLLADLHRPKARSLGRAFAWLGRGPEPAPRHPCGAG
ncbi:MAG: ThiF family adenylyltransferase [Methylococcales bacterium]